MRLSISGLCAASLLSASVSTPVRAQWVTLTNAGAPVLSTINPKIAANPQPATCANTGLPPTRTPVWQQSPTLATGKFGGLPGSAAMPGWRTTPLVAAQTAINIGSPAKNVGTLYTRLYCAGTASACSTAVPNTYVFATRVILNDTVIGARGNGFILNDVFLRVPPTSTIGVGYYMGVSGGAAPNNSQAFRFLEAAGRSNSGTGGMGRSRQHVLELPARSDRPGPVGLRARLAAQRQLAVAVRADALFVRVDLDSAVHAACASR